MATTGPRWPTPRCASACARASSCPPFPRPRRSRASVTTAPIWPWAASATPTPSRPARPGSRSPALWRCTPSISRRRCWGRARSPSSWVGRRRGWTRCWSRWAAAGSSAAWPRGSRSPRVVGVEPEAAPTLTRALEAGKLVDAPAGGLAADSLAPRRVGALMFPIAQTHIARVILVDDAAIRRAQEALWEALRVVAEPGGAAALSALVSGAYVPDPGERVGVVVSGGNTTAVDFAA